MKQETAVKGANLQPHVMFQCVIAPEHKHGPAVVQAPMLILCDNHKRMFLCAFPRKQGYEHRSRELVCGVCVRARVCHVARLTTGALCLPLGFTQSSLSVDEATLV